MAVKNNYWKTSLNKQPRGYLAWPGGWEIHIRIEDEQIFKMHLPTGKFKSVARPCIPSGCPVATRKDFHRTLAMDKRIAQSVASEHAYKELCKRIDREDWDHIEKLDLKDAALINWAYNTHTAAEYNNLLRYN